MRVIHSVVICEKPPSKRPRIMSRHSRVQCSCVVPGLKFLQEIVDGLTLKMSVNVCFLFLYFSDFHGHSDES